MADRHPARAAAWSAVVRATDAIGRRARALNKLAVDHAFAARTGMDPTQVRSDRRMVESITRRSFGDR